MGDARQTVELVGLFLGLSLFLYRGGSQVKVTVFEVTKQNQQSPDGRRYAMYTP
jgi:hypothetical protein